MTSTKQKHNFVMSSLKITASLFLMLVLMLMQADVVRCANVCSGSQRYVTNCKFWGWSTCTKYRQITFCCPGWGGSSCSTPKCYQLSGFCMNGGTCLASGSCECHKQYYGSRCQNRCPDISNCDEERCHHEYLFLWTSRCDKCNGDYGSKGQAFKVSQDEKSCIEQCSWRTGEDDNACFPGTCTNKQCICKQGFFGKDCRTISGSLQPDVLDYRATIRQGLTTREAPPPQPLTGNTNFINLRDFTQVEILWKTSFHYNIPNDLAIPAYLNQDSPITLGLVHVSARVAIEEYSSLSPSKSGISPWQDIGDSKYSEFSFNKDYPSLEAFEWKPNLPLPVFSQTLTSNHRINVTFSATNGGVMRLFNRDNLYNPNEVKTRYYMGSTVTRTAYFRFDFEPPYHCIQENPECLETMMRVSPDISTQNYDVTVSWSGWRDDVSGVIESMYMLGVHEVTGSHGSGLLVQSLAELPIPTTHTSPQTISLSGLSTGVYAFVLVVHDNAGNTNLARRFLFHDNGTKIILSTKAASQPLVTTASLVTDHTWITNISDSGLTSVELAWKDYFANHDHDVLGLLNSISDHGEIVSDYDQNFGTRGKAAIPNALGITQFRVTYTIDVSSGGKNAILSNTDPSSWYDLGVSTRASYLLDISDGYAIRFWIWARDIVGHTNETSLLVHVDSSPPTIANLWLERDGETNLAVYNTIYFLNMSATFEAYDEHSGLKSIHWRLFDNFTGSDIPHGNGTIPSAQPCEDSNCVCIPQGNCTKSLFSIDFDDSLGHHDHDYYLTVTVTNNAELTSSHTLKITIDTSPPIAGVVHDGMPGSPEVDFQQTLSIVAHWDGFFDQESGIKFYEYTFGTDCWKDSLSTQQEMEMLRTVLPNVPVEWTAPGPGRYYVTVVAYNRALEPSKPVCSDGVTIDSTPPEITSINIERARVKSGLVMDSETGEIWFVGSDRKRCLIESVDSISSCPDQPLSVDDIALIPERSDLNNSLCPLTTMHYCRTLGTNVFLPVDKHIVISWNGFDKESMISDYEIGFSSNPNNEIQDLVRYSTQGHNHYIMYHPELNHGMMIYLMLKATNKAQLSTRKIIGPIIIDTTPPEVNGHVTLDVSNNILVAKFRNQDVVDDEDPDINIKIAVGHHEKGNDVLPYRDIRMYENYEDNVHTWINIPLDVLEWSIHADHVYYASIRVENSAGLSSVLTSLPYKHIRQLPSKGVVLDVEVMQEGPIRFGESRDIDVQMNTSYIATQWYGFQHPHLNITYKIAIGSEPGETDVTNGYLVITDSSFYIKEELNLTPFKTYYSTVKAETEAGYVSVTSDGVTIIPEGSMAEGFEVFDGPLCSNNNNNPPAINSQATHHEQLFVPPCEDDMDFQASTAVVDTHWMIPDNLKPYVTHVYWSLEEEVYDANSTSTTWTVVKDFIDLGFALSHRQSNVFLKEGGHYRAIVKLCHTVVCFGSETTDGYWIISHPPSPGKIQIQSVQVENDVIHLAVTFQDFTHQYLVKGSQDTIKYQWALLEDILQNDNRFITKWQKVNDEAIFISGGMMQFQAVFNGYLPRSSCIKLAMRGYNKAGLFSTAFTEVFDCTNPEQILPNIVIDVNHDVMLPENEQWHEPDVDYTSSSTSLFAVWPTLRHSYYVWAVIEDIEMYGFQQEEQAPKEPCEHPAVLRCGSTDVNFVNIHEITLKHGMRYKVCIHANETHVDFEKWTQTLPEASVCSDGVVVDITPPSVSKARIGWNEHRLYQVSTSELVVSWDSFIDVEEHGKAPHHSGIKEYEFAIGSFPGESDVRGFEKVGISNSAIARGLKLQNGHRYYAVVKGTDFVGLSSYAVSEAITIDTTPPETRSKAFDIGGTFLRSVSDVIVNWQNVFVDLESGIAFYEWAIGSNPGHSDVMSFKKTDEEKGTTDFSEPINLQQGHSYYMTVKATNRVGLATLKSFGAFGVDASEPIGGHVYDGSLGLAFTNRKDQDFQTDTTTLHAFWEGFHDPHSSLVGYWWTIGTCSACNDVLPEQYLGLETNATARYLSLVSGLVYFVTVRSCNAADLCTSVTSDGILIDGTPPSIGRVYDGPPGRDTSFQVSRVYLAAHWWGFHDSQSGLSHYEWKAGTQKGGSDIMSETRLHLTDSVLKILDTPMPDGTMIYISVRAYNRVGLWSEGTSNGFQIDTTAPDVVQLPMVDSTTGVIHNGTQVMRSLIAIFWKFNDPESGIVAHYLSVAADHNDDVEIPPLKISGSAVDYTFTNLDLHDGSQYTVGVMACNTAGICTEYYKYTFKMDSSPPTTGFFAIQSEHAANLVHREIDGYMNWDQGSGSSVLSLAWLGFSDIHSAVSHYFLTIGTEFNGNDLLQDGKVRVDHDENGTNTEEGPIQQAAIPLQGTLANYQTIYVMLWAVNKIGLESNRAIAAFELLPNNVLLLVRRCITYSCDGHCVCASQDKLCQRRESDCRVPYTGETTINVSDVLNLQLETPEDIDYSPSRCVMAAVWYISRQEQDTVKWYEWSVGLEVDNEPAGVFDITHDRVWYDAGLEKKATLPLPRGRELETRSTAYVFFVRAWFNSSTYAVYRSDGITPDISPPQINRQRAVRVKEMVSAGGGIDVDITTNSNTIFVSWKNVFADSSGFSHFEVALGTLPEGEDTRKFSDHRISADVNIMPFSNLNLEIGKRYFCSVRAYNKAGLHTTQSSDGFIVDTIPPSAGIVYDGKGPSDVEYQNSSMLVSASWHGFVDFESYIYRYEWCVGSTNAPDEFDIMECTSVGLQTTASTILKAPLNNGLRYYSKIFAIDSAEHRSNVAISDGITVDTTPPQPMKALNFSTNLLQNPSFELTNVNTTSSQGDNPEMEDLETLAGMQTFTLTYWNISLNTKAQVVRAGEDLVKHGLQMAIVFGSLSQTIETRIGQTYQISFYVSHVPTSQDPLVNQGGAIKAPGLNEVFKLYNRPTDAHSSDDNTAKWLRQTFYFTAQSEESKITLSSLGRSNGILLDNIQVQSIYNIDSSDISVDIDVQFVLDLTSVDAKWQFVDPESPIVEYRWAIGYIKGGTQLQNFKSVGTRTHASNTDLALTHGSKVTVTVMARNAAGLTALSYSKAILIDRTPPIIHYVNDGSHQVDTDNMLHKNLTISWSSTDQESDIQYCEYALGSSPGGSDIFPVTRHLSSVSQIKLQLGDLVPDGQAVYSTVTCVNSAMLSTSLVSDGVIIVTQPPKANFASVAIQSSGVTLHPHQEMYQSDTAHIRAFWNGFVDPVGIAFYECTLSGPSFPNGNWTRCGSSSEHHVTFGKLNLENGANYSLYVRAVNNIGLRSESTQATITVDSSKPELTDDTVGVTWMESNKILITWENVFHSTSRLIYEISIGTLEGGSDVLQWVETLETRFEASPLYQSTDYYITLTAINAAGLYETLQHRIIG